MGEGSEARARPSQIGWCRAPQRRSESVHGNARLTGARGIQTSPGGGEGKAREQSWRARPTQVLFLSPRHPPSAGWSVSRAGGKDACAWEGRARRGCAGVRVREWAPGIRGLHRAARIGHRRGHGPAPERARPRSELGSPLCTSGKGWNGAFGSACAHARAWALGPKPWTSGAIGFPGWGLRVESSLGK